MAQRKGANSGPEGPEQDAASAEEVRDQLGEDDLSHRLRKLRTEKGMSLRAMAKEAGVSVSFLSQVETGRASPSIPTLIRMARALDEHVATLFEPRNTSRLIRPGDRPKLVHPHRQWTEELLSPRDFKNVQLVYSEIAPGTESAEEAYEYEPAETCVLVMEGSIEFTLDGETMSLEVGDCLAFNSSSPHRLSNKARKAAAVLWVSSPPAY